VLTSPAMPAPMFITFEGIDGSGKSTHLRRAAEWLDRHGVAHLRTHEPGGTPLGESLRQLFLDPSGAELDGTVELLMLFASRRQHLLLVIEPALAAGRIVLCDRFTDSTRAYQGYGRGVPLALIEQIDSLATGGRRPDRTGRGGARAPPRRLPPRRRCRPPPHRPPGRRGPGILRAGAPGLSGAGPPRAGALPHRRLGRRPGAHRESGADSTGRSAAGRYDELGRRVERMNLAAAVQAARQGQLYPGVILHGGDPDTRSRAAVELARALLCEAPPAERPCGACRHCRRIVWPAGGTQEGPFHPDFQVLERDLKTSTSVDATRALMRGAQVSPFEARGQVFVIASAESLGGEAANALLKSLEEPHVSAPRHFLLLAPSRLDLLPTLRSRSLAVFLGPSVAPDPERVEAVARAFAVASDAYAQTGAGVYLLRAAEALVAAGASSAGGGAGGGSGGARGAGGSGAGGWDDPRAVRPWALAAAAVLRSLPAPAVAATPAATSPGGISTARPPLALQRAGRLALAEALLTGPSMRLRGISAERILEGLVARHLAPLATAQPRGTAGPSGGSPPGARRSPGAW
jgi:DNA polymerase III delta prime subunit